MTTHPGRKRPPWWAAPDVWTMWLGFLTLITRRLSECPDARAAAAGCVLDGPAGGLLSTLR